MLRFAWWENFFSNDGGGWTDPQQRVDNAGERGGALSQGRGSVDGYGVKDVIIALFVEDLLYLKHCAHGFASFISFKLPTT